MITPARFWGLFSSGVVPLAFDAVLNEKIGAVASRRTVSIYAAPIVLIAAASDDAGDRTLL